MFRPRASQNTKNAAGEATTLYKVQFRGKLPDFTQEWVHVFSNLHQSPRTRYNMKAYFTMSHRLYQGYSFPVRYSATRNWGTA